jgi:AcrR family transcriptional regulator
VHAQVGPRPRVEGAREREILDATLDLVAEAGYDRLTLDAVATRARASKATLYRRWPGKAELVVDAVSCLFPDPIPAPDHGDLRSDLVAVIGSKQQSLCGQDTGLGLLTGLLSAMTHDPALRDAVRDRFMRPAMATTLELMRRASLRGEIREGVDLELLAATLPALMLFRLSVTGLDEPFQDFAVKIVDQIILPAATAQG